MSITNNEFTIKQAIEQYRKAEKTDKVIEYFNEVPYMSRIVLYKGKCSHFENFADFYANIDRNNSSDPVWEWAALSPDDWKDMQDDKNAAFGACSVYRLLHDELRSQKAAKHQHFKTGWRLFESWDMETMDSPDDKYTLCCLAEVGKNYFFFIYEGFVVH